MFYSTFPGYGNNNRLSSFVFRRCFSFALSLLLIIKNYEKPHLVFKNVGR